MMMAELVHTLTEAAPYAIGGGSVAVPAWLVFRDYARKLERIGEELAGVKAELAWISRELRDARARLEAIK
jgi:hypothetical protein